MLRYARVSGYQFNTAGLTLCEPRRDLGHGLPARRGDLVASKVNHVIGEESGGGAAGAALSSSALPEEAFDEVEGGVARNVEWSETRR